MAQSKCAKCGYTEFEVVDAEPRGSRFILLFVQCAKCGTVVGVTEAFNIGALLKSIEKKLGG